MGNNKITEYKGSGLKGKAYKTIVHKQTKSKIHNWKTVMTLTWYRLFQWKRWVELFFSVPNLLLPLLYKVSVVTMKSSIPDNLINSCFKNNYKKK